jgi:D-alanine--poly(phosphoribitol) ligase subunit 2
MSHCVEKLTDIFSNKLSLDVDSPDADLLNTGLLDSMRLVELLLTIEQEFRIRIKLEETDLDNFRSISSIAAMLGDPPGWEGRTNA